MPPFGELPLDGVVATFRTALDRSLGLDPGQREVAATTVSDSSVLVGTGLVAITAAGRHRLVACDPAVREVVADLADVRRTADPAELAFEVARRGAEEIETTALQIVHRAGLRGAELPPGGSVVRCPGTDAADVVDELITACQQDVAVETGLALQPLTAATIASDRSGVPVAAVTERPATLAPGFAELGVLVRASARAQGWGAGVVAAATTGCFAAGRLPMCRSEIGHGTALRLAARLGYRRVGELRVSRFDAYASTSSSGRSSTAERSSGAERPV